MTKLKIPPVHLESFLDRCAGHIEAQLARYLPSAEQVPKKLHQAMRYAVLDGGKRIRPALAYTTAEALDINQEVIDPIACSVELMHCYSLVHDDLPAMDDDDLRRGKPTCHKAFGEATAILAGDAIQALAFSCLAEANTEPFPTFRANLFQALAHASGSRGMAGGQAIDLDAVNQPLSLPELEEMHRRKTGALIKACVLMPSLCAQSPLSEDQQAGIDQFGDCLGLAFQIRDDILDEISDSELLGKPQGSDSARNKPTYVSLLGLDKAQRRCEALLEEALSCIQDMDERADTLRALASYIICRDH